LDKERQMTEKDVGQLEHINVSIAAWEQRRDPEAIAELEKSLSPKLLFRRADGTVVGNQEFMAGLAQPSPFVKRESALAALEIRGDRALAVVTVATTKEDGTENRYRNVRMFVCLDGRWQLEFWFNDDLTHVTGL
jgi:hypothetical protein